MQPQQSPADAHPHEAPCTASEETVEAPPGLGPPGLRAQVEIPPGLAAGLQAGAGRLKSVPLSLFSRALNSPELVSFAVLL